MNQINRWLWIGDANDGRNIAAIDEAGITAVLNITKETDNFPAEAKQRIAYLRLDQDDGAPIPPATLDRAAAWLAIQGNRQRSVLIHCAAGVSRAATFATMYLMLVSALPWDVCLDAVRAVRPQVSPNAILLVSLKEWWAGYDLAAAERFPP